MKYIVRCDGARISSEYWSGDGGSVRVATEDPISFGRQMEVVRAPDGSDTLSSLRWRRASWSFRGGLRDAAGRASGHQGLPRVRGEGAFCSLLTPSHPLARGWRANWSLQGNRRGGAGRASGPKGRQGCAPKARSHPSSRPRAASREGTLPPIACATMPIRFKTMCLANTTLIL